MNILILTALLACNKGPEPLSGFSNQPGGNPLIPEVAMMPYPSDLYLQDDADTATRKRLVFPAEALILDTEPELFEAHDGFSRIVPILAWFPEGIDPNTLPTDTMDSGASVVLIDPATLEPFPTLVELDGQADSSGVQSLIIRPLAALKPDTTYVVLIRSDLKAADGGELRTTRAFTALRDDLPTSNDTIEGMRDDFAPVNATIESLNLDPESVVLGWTFSTRSEAQVTGPALAMHDIMWANTYPTAVIDTVDTRSDITIFLGHVDIPDFIGDDLALELGSDGLPVQRGTREMVFQVTVPNDITTPRPVIAYGHGFFSDKEEANRTLKPGLLQWQMSAVSIDFHGFNSSEEIDVLVKFGGPMEGLQGVVIQQMQAQAEFTAVAALIRDQLPDLITLPGDIKPLDPDAMAYMGISNGGTQGLSIAAASPAYERAVLVVPGGGWSHMLQRAVQWNTMGLLFSERYPDSRNLQLYMSLLQNMFDPADSVNFVEHLTDDRYDGRLPMKATLHEAVNDCQVSNVVTHMVARTGDVPMIVPSSIDVPLLATVEAPSTGAAVDSALFIYDEGFEDLPTDNVSPAEDNDTHGTVRKLPSYLEQVGGFLETGDIVQVCDGACDPD